PRRLRCAGCAMPPQRLETGAEIAPEHVALGEQLVDRAVDRRARYGEHATPRSEHSHANDASLYIDDRAALGGRAEREIEPQQAIDGATAATLPGAVRECDDAKMRERSPVVTSDREHDLAGARRRIGNSGG